LWSSLTTTHSYACHHQQLCLLGSIITLAALTSLLLHLSLTFFLQYALCCGNDTGFTAANKDLLLLNGGYQPRMTLASNTWQRWRMLFSGASRYITLQILTTSLQYAPECEMQMIAKDGKSCIHTGQINSR